MDRNDMGEVCQFLPFKKCQSCGAVWRTCADMLSDPQVELIGYQTNFVEAGEGFFLFEHKAPACGTTFGVSAGALAELHDGPVVVNRPVAVCAEYCLYRSKLVPCPSKCECEYVRTMLDVLKNWRKT